VGKLLWTTTLLLGPKAYPPELRMLPAGQSRVEDWMLLEGMLMVEEYPVEVTEGPERQLA
jgi:hypothetical protein